MMTARSLFLAFVMTFFSMSLIGQRVKSVSFKGLKKTQPSYLYQLIATEVEAQVSIAVIEKDVQLLKNIPGIGDASYRLDAAGNLTFVVQEIRTAVPIVNFGGIKDNIWFQLGFSDFNWRGLGQQLSAHYQNNDSRHSGQIYLRATQINGGNWGYAVSLNRWASVEPLYFPAVVNYEYTNTGLGLSAIRSFGFRQNLEMGVEYFVEEYEKAEKQFTEITPGPEALRQPKLMSRLVYRSSKLDYHFFYLAGESWQATQQNVFNTDDQTWFNSLILQGKKYNRLGAKGNLAIRMTFGISSNNDTPFAPFVVDSFTSLRGVGNRIDRGTAQAVFNIEYRQTLFEGEKWASQAVVFTDAGTWRNPGGELSDLFDKDQFRQFAGGGFRLIYKKIYGAVFRIDYGFGVFDKEERGLVIGLGQYF